MSERPGAAMAPGKRRAVNSLCSCKAVSRGGRKAEVPPAEGLVG